MTTFRKAIALGAFTIFGIHAAFAACQEQHLVAPGHFLNPKPRWSHGNDGGVVISSFLDLRGSNGKAIPVAHGVDIYHGNKVLFDQLVECGTEFAFVKIDDAFKTNRDQLQTRNIEVVPYYYLGMPPEYKDMPEKFQNDHNELNNDSIRAAKQLGTEYAKEFLNRYQIQVGMPGPAVRFQGIIGRILAVDVEEAMNADKVSAYHAHIKLPSVPILPLQREHYGAFYSVMLAEWVTQVKAQIPGVVIFFYTFPSMYKDYLASVFTRSEDNVVLHNMPIWIASVLDSGGEVDWHRTGDAQNMCLSIGAGNRCVAQQYTQRGLIGVPQIRTKSEDEDRPHIDVDRFFRVKTARDSYGPQYVRESESQ